MNTVQVGHSGWLVTYRGGVPVRRRSPIPVGLLTRPDVLSNFFDAPIAITVASNHRQRRGDDRVLYSVGIDLKELGVRTEQNRTSLFARIITHFQYIMNTAGGLPEKP